MNCSQHTAFAYPCSPAQPRTTLLAVVSVLWCCLCLGFTANAFAKGSNMVLLMDSSGSMKTTDPEDLRKPAAKLLVSLLGEDDQASIISFSDQGYPVTHLLSVHTAGGQDALFAAIDKVSSRGVYTNLYGAVAKARDILAEDSDPERRKLIVLMSDGHMDLGDEEKSRAHTQKLLTELTPLLLQDNIELQTIAFTEQSDKTLLAQIARETGGRFYVADSDQELHNSFSQIFENTAQPNMLPVEGGRFQIDDSIRQITIIGSKNSPEVALALNAPSGKRYTAGNAPEGFKWLNTPLFDMITINEPESGGWELMASGDDNKAYIITNLELKLSIHPQQPVSNQQIELQAWLEQDGEVLTRSSVLDILQLSGRVSFPDGRSATLPIQTEVTTDGNFTATGMFSALLVPPSAGQYEISLSADAGTFERKRSISFLVEAGSTVKSESAPADPMVPSSEEPASDPAETTETPPEDAIDGDLLIAIYGFIGINIFLALVVGATILLRKRKK